MNDAAIVLEARDIARAFPGVQALAGVELTLRAGEVHALMGQNGAGKSTLIKVLTGVHAPDAGRIVLMDRPSRRARRCMRSTSASARCTRRATCCRTCRWRRTSAPAGIRGIPGRAAAASTGRETNAAPRELLASLGIELDVTQLAGGLPAALQQLATVARAVATDARVLILDEPTSSLDADEVQALFALMRRLRDRGVAILFVTHFLDQVYEICDRMTVLRNGRFVGEYACAKLDARGLVAAMVGRELAQVQDAPRACAAAAGGAAPVLAARNLSRRGQLKPMDIELRAGEVLGLAGLLGSGRTELARLLFALDARDSGEIRVDGKPASSSNPPTRCSSAWASAPRIASTAASWRSCRCARTSCWPCRRAWASRNFLKPAEQRALAEKLVAALGVKTASIETPIGQLSGGNQQKAIIARWLATQSPRADPR